MLLGQFCVHTGNGSTKLNQGLHGLIDWFCKLLAQDMKIGLCHRMMGVNVVVVLHLVQNLAF